MPVLFDISVLALVFFSFLFFDSINSILGDVFVFVFYAFILANLGESVSKLAIFYLLMTLFNLIMNLTPFKVNNNNKIGSIVQVFTSPIPMLQVLGGLALTVVFIIMSTGAKAAVFGTPALASGVSILSPVMTGFSLAAIALLGIAENRFAIVLTNIVASVNPFQYFAAVPLIAIVMGLFHAGSYGATGIGSLIFPSLAFGIIITTALVLKDDVVSNTGHFWYNSLINLNRSLVIRI